MVLSCIHQDAIDLFNVCSDLRAVCWKLWDTSKRLPNEVAAVYLGEDEQADVDSTRIIQCNFSVPFDPCFATGTPRISMILPRLWEPVARTQVAIIVSEPWLTVKTASSLCDSGEARWRENPTPQERRGVPILFSVCGMCRSEALS